MRELEIKLTGQQNISEVMMSVDDKPVNFAKNEFGNVVCRCQTENDKVNIKVSRMLDVGGFGWFVTQIFFFIISIFGIFDIHRKERCMVVDYESEFDLKEDNKLTLKLNTPQENFKAIDVETDLESHEISNKYILDAAAKKTLKALKWTKILLTVAVVVTAVVVLITKL